MSNGLDIPVTWIYEQIKEHPGMRIFSRQDILSSLLRMMNMSECTKT